MSDAGRNPHQADAGAGSAFDVVPRAAHLVGICGSGMRALAEFLIDSGWRVTGSDLQVNSKDEAHFAALGISAASGRAPETSFSHLEALVYSPAVPEADPDRCQGRALGIPQFSYPQMLSRLMQGRQTVCIAGTHGKSTTTAMTGWILRAAGLAPGVIVGAELRDLDRSGWEGEGSLLVVESCEYQRHFLDYTPRFAAVLSVEPDHFDCFEGPEQTRDAFRRFAGRLPPDGCLIVPAADPSGIDWRSATRARIETFAVNRVADWSAVHLQPTRQGTRFEIHHQGQAWGTVDLRIPGQHNVANAVAAAGLAAAAGANPLACARGLESFPGLHRRFEVRGEARGITLLDDYAHHPTAIQATIRAAREQYPDRRLVGVFQPHQISRTEALFEDFAKALAGCDTVWISPVFTAREQDGRGQGPRISQQLSDRVRELGGSSQFLPALDPLNGTLDDSLQAGDVLLTMGAGDISQLHHAFTRRLQRNHGS